MSKKIRVLAIFDSGSNNTAYPLLNISSLPISKNISGISNEMKSIQTFQFASRDVSLDLVNSSTTIEIWYNELEGNSILQKHKIWAGNILHSSVISTHGIIQLKASDSIIAYNDVIVEGTDENLGLYDLLLANIHGNNNNINNVSFSYKPPVTSIGSNMLLNYKYTQAGKIKYNDIQDVVRYTATGVTYVFISTTPAIIRLKIKLDYANDRIEKISSNIIATTDKKFGRFVKNNKKENGFVLSDYAEDGTHLVKSLLVEVLDKDRTAGTFAYRRDDYYVSEYVLVQNIFSDIFDSTSHEIWEYVKAYEVSIHSEQSSDSSLLVRWSDGQCGYVSRTQSFFNGDVMNTNDANLVTSYTFYYTSGGDKERTHIGIFALQGSPETGYALCQQDSMYFGQNAIVYPFNVNGYILANDLGSNHYVEVNLSDLGDTHVVTVNGHTVDNETIKSFTTIPIENNNTLFLYLSSDKYVYYVSRNPAGEWTINNYDSFGVLTMTTDTLVSISNPYFFKPNSSARQYFNIIYLSNYIKEADKNIGFAVVVETNHTYQIIYVTSFDGSIYVFQMYPQNSTIPLYASLFIKNESDTSLLSIISKYALPAGLVYRYNLETNEYEFLNLLSEDVTTYDLPIENIDEISLVRHEYHEQYSDNIKMGNKDYSALSGYQGLKYNINREMTGEFKSYVDYLKQWYCEKRIQYDMELSGIYSWNVWDLVNYNSNTYRIVDIKIDFANAKTKIKIVEAF